MLCVRPCAGGPGGKGKGQPKQNLFLIYLDALSVVNSKRADKAISQQQQQQQTAEQAAGQQAFELLQRDLSTAAPNMPDFTLKDLQFILTFTGGLASFPAEPPRHCRTPARHLTRGPSPPAAPTPCCTVTVGSLALAAEPAAAASASGVH